LHPCRVTPYFDATIPFTPFPLSLPGNNNFDASRPRNNPKKLLFTSRRHCYFPSAEKDEAISIIPGKDPTEQTSR